MSKMTDQAADDPVEFLRNLSVDALESQRAELAKKLFGQPSADRAGVIASYMDCTKKPGDAAKGKAVFQTKDDPDFQAILKTFEPTTKMLRDNPRQDMPGAQPSCECNRGRI